MPPRPRHLAIHPGSGTHSHADEFFKPGRRIHLKSFRDDNQARPLVVHITSPKPIGKGGSSSVFVAEPQLAGSSYAIALKVISQPEDPDNLELIERELFAIKEVSGQKGPHILRYLGTASAGPFTIIAAEYLANGTISEYLKRTPDADHQRLVLQVAEGLSWLHGYLRFVHGDIKSTNVLISDQNDAVIADFGLATPIDKDPLSATTATAIRNRNTFKFAAPELLGLHDDDLPPTKRKFQPRSKTSKSDVYAFAMLMLEVFTGDHPWPGITSVGIILKLEKRHKHPRPSIDAPVRGLTDSWWKIWLHCCEFVPSRRPDMREVWDELKANCRRPRLLEQHRKQIFSMAFNRSGQHIVSHSSEGSVKTSNANSGRPVSSAGLTHGSQVTCAAISPSCETIASGHDDGSIQLWNTQAQYGAAKNIALKVHTGRVHGVAFSSDGIRLVSCSQDKTVCQWTLSLWPQIRSEMTYRFEGDSEVLSLAFNPTGRYIAGGYANGKVCLWTTDVSFWRRDISAWSADDSSFKGRVAAHESAVSSVCFARETGLLVTGSTDGSVRLWNCAAGRPQSIRELVARGEPVRRAIISPSGQYVASVGEQSLEIQLRSAVTGQPLGAPLVCAEWVAEIAFSPDSRSLVAGCGNGAVYIWDLYK